MNPVTLAPSGGPLLPPVTDPIYTQPSTTAPGAPAVSASAAPAAPASTGTFGMNLSGLNVNYDLGPSTATIASQSQSWLGAQFNANTAFLGQTIIGAQNWIGGMVSPLLGAAVTQENSNTQNLPSMYGQLLANNLTLGQSAIAGQIATANASIASSNASAAAASGGGGCFITTAVCKAAGLPDDCATLTLLRAFRDGWMAATRVRRKLVARYYHEAPRLVTAIDARPDAAAIYALLRVRYIEPAVAAIRAGDSAKALRCYIGALFAAHIAACGADAVSAEALREAA